jgi:PKD repeat protein
MLILKQDFLFDHFFIIFKIGNQYIMKKKLLKTVLSILVLCSFYTSYGQVIKSASEPLKIINKQTQLIQSHSSPDLNHHHDGEHCISDALTNDWVTKYGIEEEYNADMVRQNAIAQNHANDDRATYTIPIVFHVVNNPNNPAENVSQAAINNLLAAVNLDFAAANSDIGNLRGGFGWTAANADIDFCLAQRDPWGNQLPELGINRVSTNEDFYDPNTEANKMKGSTNGDTGVDGWDRNSYINVWVCNITNGANSGVAGYAYKPTIANLPPASIDGVVIDYNLGITPSNRVLTHEIGHYLGLSHTWGNSNAATSCNVDDGLNDTPNTGGPSADFGGSCSGSQQTCAGVETQYENFMDYASCTIMYTQEQSNLMSAVLNGSRSSLLNSMGCVPINPQPPTADFYADIFSVVAGGSVNFTDISTNYPTGWTWTVSPAGGVTYIGGSTNTSQNPVIQFGTPGAYQVSLNASNAYGNDSEVKASYITVVASGGGSLDCDTIRNYTAAEEANQSAYGLGATVDGYYPGSFYIAVYGANSYQMESIADSFFVANPTEVRRIRLPIYQADDIGAANNVIFTVWGADPVNNGPGAIIGTETVPIANLNAGFWNQIDFSTPVPVSGEFWVGATFEYSNLTIEDTILFATTNFADRPSGPSSTWMQGYEPNLAANFAWQSSTNFFQSNPDCSLILDVLTSLGPSPIALASWPTAVTCESVDVTMNAFGSSNASSYYWDISDGVNDYFFDEGNLTAGFTQGNWTISLEVDGSCQTDIDGVFNLAVNPPMQETITTTDEICVAADGTINIAITGGDGGAYNYSINSGATIQNTGNYTGLIEGDYDYIFTDNNDCELTGVITIGNVNNFAPTITPDATIAALTPTTLAVTGGISWSWYEGNVQVGNTQSIIVSPSVTTTYYCSVVDGSGCEAELEVTVTTNPIDNSGVDEILTNLFSIYPNPSTGEFQMKFKLNETRDMELEISNIVGELVFKKSFEDIQNQTLNFNLDHIANGVYFITVHSKGEIVTKKIVIRK